MITYKSSTVNNFFLLQQLVTLFEPGCKAVGSMGRKTPDQPG